MRFWGRKLMMTAAMGLAGVGAFSAPAGASTPAPVPGMRLVFAEAPAHNYGNQVAVQVECEGAGGGFCSGVATLSRSGRKASAPFSVPAGASETLFVPLRLGSSPGRSAKVFGSASTSQGIGAPDSSSTTLRLG